MNALILAHQGGWDEMLLVAAPIAAFAFAMRTANRRARRVADQVQADQVQADQVRADQVHTDEVQADQRAQTDRDRDPAVTPDASPPGYVDTER